ncbi:fructosamine kinase family protein [Streptomyces boncukensis]|uniref:Phosphotransferase n=1 Tax=Streptomyces boncukensis TaxID=2711219 RepID=A0A6G4X3N3_9ACTN|nr:fructosamine kinase family protein [Streptomyces boncukensis]NGO71863.1 phosphotransferase [Streptomyces boncukensis]
MTPHSAPRDLVRAVSRAVGREAVDAVPVGGGSICDAYAVTLDGPDTRTGTGTDARTDTGTRTSSGTGSGPARQVFAKTLDAAPADFFAAEAAGLARLRATGAVAVPDVYGAERGALVLEWVEPGAADAAQAERLGRDLAALHHTPAPSYGTPGEPCYLGPLPLTSPAAPVTDPAEWPAFHAEHRLLPFVRAAVDAGHLAPGDARAVERVCDRPDDEGVWGPPQPPAVIHGDLWAGNVHWSADGRARLIDPAAQGGHPETDLALLDLFGTPGLRRVLAAYEEVRPVPGLAARMPLHQLQHLLVHAVLFGGGYGARCGAAARTALAGA